MEFGKVVVGAFAYVAYYKKDLSKALLVPFLAYLALDAITLLKLNMALSLLIWIAEMAVQTVFAITTHRVIILGPKFISRWGITKWTARETLFVSYLVGLGLLVAPFIVLGVMWDWGVIAAVLATCWLAGRLSLVFPGIAIDKGVTFGHSWKLTRHHQFLMSFVVALFPLLLSIPVILISYIPHTFILASVISTLTVVFQVAALSVAYQLITQQSYEQR